jgi:DNA-binding XRE family transcriptional regulator
MKKLKNGWVEGDTKDFLDLDQPDMDYIELRRALTRLFKAHRQKHHWTQVQVAQKLHTSQSRVAKLEKADPTVSLDLIFQSLFRVGVDREEIAEALH